MELFWWLLTIVLFAAGLIGTVAPVLPGTTIILAAAIIHRIMLGPDKSIGWYTIIVLVLLTLATYALDVLAGYFGTKYFGATKWGTFGAILGAVVGLFFGLIGLFVGPVIGAITGEIIAGKRMNFSGNRAIPILNLETRKPGNLFRIPAFFWFPGFQIFVFMLYCRPMADDRW